MQNLFLCAVVALASVWMMGCWGCSIGYDPLGQPGLLIPVGPPDPANLEQSVRGAGGVIGSIIGGPAGGVVGDAIGLGIASLFGWGGYKVATARANAEGKAFDEGVRRGVPVNAVSDDARPVAPALTPAY